MIRGLFFDLDGTLADSLDVMRTAFFRFLEGRASGVDFERFNGPPLAEIVRILKEEFGWSDSAGSLLAAYQACIDAAYDGVPPSPGGVDLLRQAKAAGWQTAVVTSNNRARLSRWLDRTGLGAWCDVLVAAEDTARGKPWPDPYLAALARTGVAEAVAIEDSAQGATAAIAAGLIAFGYQPPGRPSQHWPDGLHVVGDFSALRLHLFGVDSGHGARQIR